MRLGLRLPRSIARSNAGSNSRGQSMVEFALVIPIFLILLMAVIEFSFLMNGQLSINFATRDAALVAAEAGNAVGADCVILQKVEQDVTAPANRANISQVQIFWTNANGQPLDTSGNVTDLRQRQSSRRHVYTNGLDDLHIRGWNDADRPVHRLLAPPPTRTPLAATTSRGPPRAARQATRGSMRLASR